MARYELALPDAALEDVVQVIDELPEGPGRVEAEELRWKLEAASRQQSPSGWERMQIVENNDSEKPEDDRGPHPDLAVELTAEGIEKAKQQGNKLFASGSIEESARWFSQCIWAAESKSVLGLPPDFVSVLRSNRAFAYVKLERWADAEDDSSSALKLNPGNTKALYRRAKARKELGKAQAAWQDVEALLKALPADATGRGDAEALKEQIAKQLTAA
ncbi:unnamed protein product [Prorocentrum cordatum]|uniref:Peptidylprolyl isomerase n=1 Tax=Prorocentrum cordatum TaxID=2364126 RepID=A0ABN9QK10_9DINO|nr:unnamed protein product [Polarella glacialis]